MARRKAADTEAPPRRRGRPPKQREAEPTDTDTVRIYPSAGKIKSLLSRGRGMQAQISSLTGELREEIKNAVEKHNLHKTAFAMVKRLDKMEPEALALCWDHLIHYWEVSGLKDRAESVAGFGFEQQAATDGADIDPDENPVRIVQLTPAA